MFITAGGMIVRSPVSEMRPMGRNTQGVRLVNLKDEDELVAMEIISAVELEEYQQLAVPRRARPVLLEDDGTAVEEDEELALDDELADDEPDDDEDSDDTDPEDGE